MSDAATMIYYCCDEHRRADVRNPLSGLNGIDYLEVIDHEDMANRQLVLRVYLLKDIANALTVENVRITGGVRTGNVHPVAILSQAGKLLTIKVNTYGDYSTYTLHLVEADGRPMLTLDPLLSAIDFSFKVECPSDFDCRPAKKCAPEAAEEPEIDYLARDFNSLRQLMLDRMSVIMPQWKERNIADLGITLVELLAYLGDNLSYQQDAIATEAYLGTARRRVSVRRHARLVDYAMNDGCNARVWVQLLAGATVLVGRGTQLMTRVPGFEARLAPHSDPLDRLLDEGPEIFETMHDVELHAEHNEMLFYTWGERECHLPKGATRATLVNQYLNLRKGDVLVFQEVISPRTGQRPDADRSRRHAVRLTATPVLTVDELYPLGVPLIQKQPVTQIEWGQEDALPFPLCISAIDASGDLVQNTSVALGNIVLADHGLSVTQELETPKAGASQPAQQGSCIPCVSDGPALAPLQYHPRLKYGPLTMTGTVPRTGFVDGRRRRLPFDPEGSAASAFRWDLDLVVPSIVLDDAGSGRWFPQRDLLSSDEFAMEFVAEVEDDGRATLRFGDDVYGMQPVPGVALTAMYRIGNGAAGNIGASSLAHIVSADAGIVSVNNPLAARGGIDPESIEYVRQNAPSAFFKQERAVTAADYAEVTERHPQVQRAAATFRWTGSWRTVFVTVDRFGGLAVDATFEEEIRAHLERYRMAGYDVEVDGPRNIALEIEMKVCALPGYFRSDVKKSVLEVLGNRTMGDGRRGFFHADNFTFGQPVYLSKLYAAAQGVEGVQSVEYTTFRRAGSTDTDALSSGVLKIGRLEIARLDNDRSFPENGVIRITMGGGR